MHMERLARMTRYLLNILIPAAGWILLCTLGPRLLRFFLPFVVGWILAMIANPLVRFLSGVCGSPADTVPSLLSCLFWQPW